MLSERIQNILIAVQFGMLIIVSIIALVRVFGRRVREGDSVSIFEQRILPPWLKERRKRVDRKNDRRLDASIVDRPLVSAPPKAVRKRARERR